MLSTVLFSTQSKLLFSWFCASLANNVLVDCLKQVQLIVLDVDGTLTDGSIYVDEIGEGGRNFSVVDGFGIKKTMEAGFIICLLSGKKNNSTLRRAATLGIPEEHCFVGVEDKTILVKKMQAMFTVTSEQTLIVGDDFLDIKPKVDNIAFFATPSDSPFYIQPFADILLPLCGGRGAVRILLDLILFIHKKHFAQQYIQLLLDKNYVGN